MRSAAPLLVAAGAVLIVLGLLAWTGMVSWLGRLPGDIRIERPTMRIYVPLTSMLLLSLVVTLVLALLRRWK